MNVPPSKKAKVFIVTNKEDVISTFHKAKKFLLF